MGADLGLGLTVNDFAGVEPYIAAIPAFLARHGGRDIVRGAVPTVLEGDWKPQRLVVGAFPTPANAQAFLADPDCQGLFAIPHRITTSRLILVDGAE